MPAGAPEPRRVFLGWDRACLESAGAFLMGWYAEGQAGGVLDLAGPDAPLLVVPGGRARRTLLAILADACEGAGLVLTPPQIVTPGEVGEVLLGEHERPSRPAPPLVRRLAWIEAMRSGAPAIVEALLPSRPDDDDLIQWSALASILERRHDELAGELLRFEDVPQRAAHMPDFADDERWLAAAAIQHAYERVLEKWGVADPALVRWKAVRDGAPVAAREVVLIGVPELNRSTRTILERSPARVTALVFAPESMASRFDALGCVEVEAWATATLDLREEQILVADGPDDQADAALEAIATLGERFATDEIVIGVPDRAIVAYLRQRAERYGAVEVRDAGGTPLARTPVYRLLAAIAGFLETRSLESMAALVRHPDIEAKIERRIGQTDRVGWWLDELDEYRADHLQGRTDGAWIDCRAKRQGAVRGAYRELCRLLEALAPETPGAGGAGREAGGAGAPRRHVGAWLEPILEVLGSVYGGVERSRFGDDRLVVEACLRIRDAARGLARHASDLAIEATPAQAIRLLMEQVRATQIPERPGDETIELLGWLELALDPAPVVVVTGMNEGAVPSSMVADVLLPDRLRTVLGIADDRRRVARDAFLLSAIVGSRAHARLVVGRQNPDGDPLKPSRLLLRCDKASAVTRFARLTSEGRDERRRVELISHLRHGALSLFRAGPLVAMEPLTAMSVTSFSTYLSSPYEFYLKHVVRAKERDDALRELDGRAFGTLVHDALEAFGLSDAKHLTDPRRIDAALMDMLSTVADARFGSRPTPIVALQVELARLRLREFATCQAAWAASGWRIIATEWRPADERAAFDVDAQTMWLRGKIDRIDRNENDGRLAILDYKTGDRGYDPGDALGREGWTDLQLPLYRHLAAELGSMERVVLGYVTLAKKRGDVKFREATWGEAELGSADDVAREVVRKVRAGEFSEIGKPWGGIGSMGALCGLGMIVPDDGEDDA